MSANALARLAGVAPHTVLNLESGADFRASSMEALESTLRAKGVLFSSKGHVGVKMVWAPGSRPENAQIREAVLGVLNADRATRNQAPFVEID